MRRLPSSFTSMLTSILSGLDPHVGNSTIIGVPLAVDHQAGNTVRLREQLCARQPVTYACGDGGFMCHEVSQGVRECLGRVILLLPVCKSEQPHQLVVDDSHCEGQPHHHS